MALPAGPSVAARRASLTEASRARRIMSQPQASAAPHHGSSQPPPNGDEDAAIEQLHAKYTAVREQLRGVIVGMDDAIEQLMIAMLCRGHVILEGVPGLAKTLLVST